jgi:hypothetical protein
MLTFLNKPSKENFQELLPIFGEGKGKRVFKLYYCPSDNFFKYPVNQAENLFFVLNKYLPKQ